MSKTTFSDEQQKVINQIDGRVLVVACPGSGKTTTVLERAKHMVDSGISPETILIVTFSRNAAQELTERFRQRYNINGVTFGTIHSICFNVLRRVEGFTGSNILKEWEQYKFFSSYLAKDASPVDKENFCKGIIGEISYVRNAMLPPELFQCRTTLNGKPADFMKLFNDYEAFKRKENKVDFDDMLIRCLDVLRHNKEELNAWQEKYHYFVVDEFQDTNIVQSRIFYLLSEKYGNLCAVGDDDQSIYGFRSADSTIMLNFRKTFPDAKQFYLSSNYRSSKEIIRQASNLIAHNKIRFDKEFKCAQTRAGRIATVISHDEDPVTKLIADIKRRHANGEDYNDMAILFRLNRSGTALMARLMKEDIPFRTNISPQDIHGEVLFEDIKHYWHLANEGLSWEHLKPVIGHPTRYFRKDLFVDCEPTRKAMRERIWEFNMRPEIVEERKRKNQKDPTTWNLRALDELFELLDDLKGRDPEDFFQILVNDKYEKWLLEDYASYNAKDAEVLKGIISALEEESKQFPTMEDWVEFAVYYKEILKEKKESKNGVTLSTFHGSKGLEWETVYIAYADNGVTPYKDAVEDSEIEEERRMFYVAVTRAKKNLSILASNPSYFLEEMEEEPDDIDEDVMVARMITAQEQLKQAEENRKAMRRRRKPRKKVS